MENLPKIENGLQLQDQLEKIAPKYYALWDEIEKMHANLRVHLSTINAAFLGIIVSLHHTSSNIFMEWSFFICVVLCTLSLVCLLVSSFENLQNSIALRKIIKETCDKALKMKTPIKNLSFSSPRKKVYSVLFWLGIIFFVVAIIIFCILNIPIW